jgi:hypothetical protein
MHRLRGCLLLVLLLPFAGVQIASGSSAARLACTMSCCRQSAPSSECTDRRAPRLSGCSSHPTSAATSAFPPLVAASVSALPTPGPDGVLGSDAEASPLPAFAHPPDQPPRA